MGFVPLIEFFKYMSLYLLGHSFPIIGNGHGNCLERLRHQNPDTAFFRRMFNGIINEICPNLFQKGCTSIIVLPGQIHVKLNLFCCPFILQHKDTLTDLFVQTVPGFIYDHFNEKADEEARITYTDYVAMLTSSVTTIIDGISYVLIAFVGISLLVSCIMIGIITHISVMERTKEIGILRALGASKRNISQVFNAETFIIGCCAGLLGIGLSMLALVPINSMIEKLSGITGLNAQLPIASSFVLIVISIAITILGGLLPAKKAAKKDPVVALRTE